MSTLFGLAAVVWLAIAAWESWKNDYEQANHALLWAIVLLMSR